MGPIFKARHTLMNRIVALKVIRKEKVANAEGKAEGLQEGQLRARRADLRTLLEDRFGALPEDLIRRLAVVEDLERLRAAIRQVYHLQKLDDLQL